MHAFVFSYIYWPPTMRQALATQQRMKQASYLVRDRDTKQLNRQKKEVITAGGHAMRKEMVLGGGQSGSPL